MIGENGFNVLKIRLKCRGVVCVDIKISSAQGEAIVRCVFKSCFHLVVYISLLGYIWHIVYVGSCGCKQVCLWRHERNSRYSH